MQSINLCAANEPRATNGNRTLFQGYLRHTAINKTIVLSALLLAFSGASCIAAPAFEDLGDQLLSEGLDGLFPPERESERADAIRPGQGQTPLRGWMSDQEKIDPLTQESLEDSNKGEDLGTEESPLVRVGKGMDKAKRLIDQLDTTGQTRQVQEQVVSDLKELIEKLQEQRKQGGQGEGQQSSRSRQQSKRSEPKQVPGSMQGSANQGQAAAKESSLRLGSAKLGAVEGRSREELMKAVWGHLPERIREQMLQSSSDEFLPKYRDAIERYFEGLAEESAEGLR